MAFTNDNHAAVYSNTTMMTCFVRLYLHGTLEWRHNGCEGVSIHQPHDCLLNCLFRCRSKKTSKLRVTVLCEGNSPVTGEFPAQRASNAGNISIWWRHHENNRYKNTSIVTEHTLLMMINFLITRNPDAHLRIGWALNSYLYHFI